MYGYVIAVVFVALNLPNTQVRGGSFEVATGRTVGHDPPLTNNASSATPQAGISLVPTSQRSNVVQTGPPRTSGRPCASGRGYRGSAMRSATSHAAGTRARPLGRTRSTARSSCSNRPLRLLFSSARVNHGCSIGVSINLKVLVATTRQWPVEPSSAKIPVLDPPEWFDSTIAQPALHSSTSKTS